jgi:hypothetical protein
MRTRLIIIIPLLTTIIVIARQIQPFLGWDHLEQESPNIIIACCSKAPAPPGPQLNGLFFSSGIEVVAILKGTNNLGPALLESEYWPRQSENYLIFGYYNNGSYRAPATYCVVPLGLYFSTNILSGKTLDEQIQTLLQHRLDNLNQQMKEEQDEKQRLEEEFKK